MRYHFCTQYLLAVANDQGVTTITHALKAFDAHRQERGEEALAPAIRSHTGKIYLPANESREGDREFLRRELIDGFEYGGVVAYFDTEKDAEACMYISPRQRRRYDLTIHKNFCVLVLKEEVLLAGARLLFRDQLTLSPHL